MRRLLTGLTIGTVVLVTAARFFSGRGLKPSIALAQGGAAIVPGKDFGALMVNALMVKKDSGIKSAKQREGRSVAVNTLKNINETA